jgi:hypothetical protein
VHHVPKSRNRTVLILSVAIGLAACGSDAAGSEPAGGSVTSTSVLDAAPTTSLVTVTTEPPPTTSTTLDESWRADAVAWCEEGARNITTVAPPSSDEDVARFVADYLAAHEAPATEREPAWPTELTEAPYDIDRLQQQQEQWLQLAAEQLAAGKAGSFADPEYGDTAWGSIDFHSNLAGQVATTLAIAGVRCGPADPARTAQAALNIPILAAWHLSTGFGSVWVSNRAEQQVHRINAESGATEAVIDVGSVPFRSQTADGRIVVRTAEGYQFIDPETNTITDTLRNSDVGPAAGFGWAVDGALWICDGPQLHRHDPTTLERQATIALDFECGNVHATDDLVIAWTGGDTLGESGASAAAMIEPATNSVRTTIDLPVDVGRPTVFGTQLFFPAEQGSTSVVVDISTGNIAATPDLGRPYVHANPTAYDGTHLYALVDGRDIVVVDPTTFDVVETIEPMDFNPPFGVQVNSFVIDQGALWVVNDASAILQRFDRPS